MNPVPTPLHSRTPALLPDTHLLPKVDAPISPATAPTGQPVPIIRTEKPGPWLQIATVAGFEWNQVSLPICNLPGDLEGLRILHLTDFHLRGNLDRGYQHLIARVRQKPPDIILFTGDFVDDRFDYRKGLPQVRELVKSLPSRLGFYAILGNHDGDLLGAALSDLNITLVDHRQISLKAGLATLELIGVAGVDRLDMDLHWLRNLEKKTDRTVRIAMSHYPDTLEKSEFLKPDLFLCGHTHGGQICLPGGAPIFRHDSLPRRLCTGIHRAFGTWLIVNRGMGYSSGLRMRLFCPAEAIEITLTRV
ncbi:MAG: metallophosphoesterase [Planctomycetota bacterium]|nr:metallophosphoesterase [Planctomycetota bacterium]